MIARCNILFRLCLFCLAMRGRGLPACRLADLLDAPALLAESLAVLACMAPGPETFAPLLALAEGRQYNEALQHLKACDARAAALSHALGLAASCL